jgi:nitric oxide dioxygenase
MMLSQKTIEIVKSTVPILAARGTEITSCFYRMMLNNHPELLNIFNHANQQKGRQQTALANTVYAAAKHIDQLHVLLPTVKQIAHKHRSLGVKPEHYPIVGKHLLLAIKEVLGDEATDEVLQAWEEAYGVIAKVFIDIEQEMYKEAAEQEGGWKDFKEFVLVRKEEESSVITSFYLKPKDGAPLPMFQPGQYITVRLQIPGEEYTLNRQYSLSSAPGNNTFRISVKREADRKPHGKVSNYLHDHFHVGDTIEVSVPAGDFVLEETEENDVAFISGGVGVTPMMSMLEHLVKIKSNRRVSFIHAAKNEDVHAFKEDVKQLIGQLEHARQFTIYEQPINENSEYDLKGFITKDFLQSIVHKDTICYVCGPVPFMRTIIHHLQELGLPETHIRYEFFGPSMAMDQLEIVNS